MSNEPVTIVDVGHLRSYLQQLRSQNEKLAFVPTMGALHEGHLSLVRQARHAAKHVCVSIFVNPTQFGPSEDFAAYPRTLREDLALLAKEGVEVVFAPNANSMYPENFQTYVVNEELSKLLCGASRPGHFRGVLTIVLKLLNIVQPDVAIFGKKDYQQLTLIRNMARDLQVPVEIIGGDIVREPDGLAMSSRNRYFSPEARQKAVVIPKALAIAQSLVKSGDRTPEKILSSVREVLSSEADLTIDYVELCDAETLRRVEQPFNETAVLLVAAFLAGVRLIDNVELAGSESAAVNV